MDVLKKHRVDSSPMNMMKMVHKYIKHKMCVKLKYTVCIWMCINVCVLSNKALSPLPETRF